MNKLLYIGGLAVLAAALLLVHLVRVDTTSPNPSKTSGAPASERAPNVASMRRAVPIERAIAVEGGAPIAAGLPPWTVPLATLRPPPPPEGTAVPVVPRLGSSR